MGAEQVDGQSAMAPGKRRPDLSWLVTVGCCALCMPWLAPVRLLLGACTTGALADPAARAMVLAVAAPGLLACALALAALSAACLRGARVPQASAGIMGIVLAALGSALCLLAPRAAEVACALGAMGGCCCGLATGLFLGLHARDLVRLPDLRLALGVLLVAAVQCAAVNLLRAAPLAASSAVGPALSAASCVLALRLHARAETGGPAPGPLAAGSPLFKLSVRRYRLRLAGTSLLVGAAFGTMLCVFVATTGRGTIPASSWNLLLAGVPTCALVLAASWPHTRELDFFRALRMSCIVAIPAFFPLKVGTYALRFAFDFTAVAFVTVTCALAMVLATSERRLRAAGTSSGLVGAAGLALGLACGVGCAFGLVLREAVGEDVVYFAGLLSLICVFVATNGLVSQGQLVTIERIAAGRFPARIDAAEKLMGTPGTTDTLARVCKELALESCLTDREVEVLMILARGSSLARVQEDLLISEGTAITHRSHIYRKLGVHSKQELIDLIDARMERG